MTNKDLNLNLDQRLARQHTGAPPTTLREVPESGQRPPPTATSSKGPKTSKPAAQRAGRPGVPVVAVICIVLVNFLLMAAAGYWLYSRVEQKSLPVAPATPQTDPRMELALATLDRDLLALQTRLEQLQLTVSEQQQLIGEAYRDTEAQPQPQPQPAQAQPEAETTAPAVPARVIVADNWVINAGTFPGREGAARLQKQLLDLGYEASIHDVDSEDKQAHRVYIQGYSDRASAEQAAQLVMGQTELNGLWVSKDG